MASRFEGRILAVEGDEFTAEVIALDSDVPIVAEFASADLPHDEPLQPGDVFTITGQDMRLVDLGRWTAEEIAAIRERALQQMSRLLDRTD